VINKKIKFQPRIVTKLIMYFGRKVSSFSDSVGLIIDSDSKNSILFLIMGKMHKIPRIIKKIEKIGMAGVIWLNKCKNEKTPTAEPNATPTIDPAWVVGPKNRCDHEAIFAGKIIKISPGLANPIRTALIGVKR
jgi:hypothetical protein